MAAPKIVTAALAIIGNEILSGRTVDKNLPFLATRLNDIGVQLREVRVVPDVEDEIVRAVNELRARYDYVFTTGGIGPTHDDITARSVAQAFGVALERHPGAVAALQRYYEPGRLNEARLRMADVPAGAVLIDNPVSGAPGFQIANVFVLPGVPAIMQAMFDGITDRLVGGPPILSEQVATDLMEGTMAVDLGAIQDRFPDVSIGSYPYFRAGRAGVNLVLRSTDPGRLRAAAGEVRAMIQRLDGSVLT